MKPGNIVRIKRASLGIPAGTLAFIIKQTELRAELGYGDGEGDPPAWDMFWVEIIGTNRRRRKFLRGDLEVYK